MMEEKTILKAVEAALEHEPAINLHRCPIRLSFHQDALVVEGEVENVAAKKQALELAARTAGVVGIVDRLRVRAACPMSDAEIRDRVRDALQQEPTLRECTLRVAVKGGWELVRGPASPVGEVLVEVRDGVVTLNGVVPSLTHKRLAGVLGWWVPGSRDVVNGIEVIPEREDTPDELTDAVRLVLEKDPFVDARHIRVTSAGGVVRLQGVVPNERILAMAENDTWFIFGVDRVVNDVQVRAWPSSAPRARRQVPV